jgi:hypothetical protein
MLLADILFLTIVVYLAYRFIFNFLLPIVRATHQVRQQFRDMRGSGGSGGSPRGSSDAAASGAASASRPGSGGGGSRTAGNGGGKGTYKPPAEDYIDFEEVK